MNISTDGVRIPSSMSVLVRLTDENISKLDLMMKDSFKDSTMTANKTATQIFSSIIPLFREEVYIQGGEDFAVKLLLALHHSSQTQREGSLHTLHL